MDRKSTFENVCGTRAMEYVEIAMTHGVSRSAAMAAIRLVEARERWYTWSDAQSHADYLECQREFEAVCPHGFPRSEAMMWANEWKRAVL